MTTEEWLKKINQDTEKLNFLKENKNLDKVWLLIQKKTLVLMKKMYTFFPQAISLITLFFFKSIWASPLLLWIKEVIVIWDLL